MATQKEVLKCTAISAIRSVNGISLYQPQIWKYFRNDNFFFYECATYSELPWTGSETQLSTPLNWSVKYTRIILTKSDGDNWTIVLDLGENQLKSGLRIRLSRKKRIRIRISRKFWVRLCPRGRPDPDPTLKKKSHFHYRQKSNLITRTIHIKRAHTFFSRYS